MSPPAPDEEDDQYDLQEDNVIIKQEDDEAMDDAAAPGIGNLPPAYKVVLAAGYDEEALIQQVLEASKVGEDAAFPDLQEAIALTKMVAEHMASLPTPPLLPAHAPPQAAYQGQEVLSPSGAPPRQRRQDHPHVVGINPRSPSAGLR
jgi:hypothetical protein